MISYTAAHSDLSFAFSSFSSFPTVKIILALSSFYFFSFLDFFWGVFFLGGPLSSMTSPLLLSFPCLLNFALLTDFPVNNEDRAKNGKCQT